MKFKDFLREGTKEDIVIELNNMSEYELHEFGEWLYMEFYGATYDEAEELGGAEPGTEGEKITKEEIIEMLGEMSEDDLEYILDEVKPIDDDDDSETAHTSDNVNIDEGVARRLKAKNKNKKTRKFMGNSKADMRRTKVARKKDARKNRVKRKRNYRKNKVKVLAYGASRRTAIKKGSHKVKLRKKA